MDTSFVLQEEVQLLQNDNNDYIIENEIQIEGRSEQELARLLNSITESIEVSSASITDSIVFDKLRSLLKYIDKKKVNLSKNCFAFHSSFRTEIKTTADDLNNNEIDSFSLHRICLEHYIFLTYWFLIQSEEILKSSSLNVNKSKRSKGKADDNRPAILIPQKKKTFDLLAWLLELKLTKIWSLTPERTALINLFTKPCYQVFENAAYIRSTELKSCAFKILSLCVKYYDHLLAAQTAVIQNLKYWEHCAEPMAEWLYYLIDKYDYGQLADELLREIGNQEFKDTAAKEVKDTSNPKTFSAFLLKLTELSPKTILKNLGVLIHQLDSESYTIRVAIIDILGKLIIELTKSNDESQTQKDQINGFFDILEERMLDPISFCRSRVLQTYIQLLDLRIKFPKRRQALCILAVRHLEDKSSIVRKYAVRTLTKLISTHPYDMYGGELALEDWQKRLNKLNEELQASTTAEEELVLGEALTSNEQSGNNEQEGASKNGTSPTNNETEDTEMDGTEDNEKGDKEDNQSKSTEEGKDDSNGENENDNDKNMKDSNKDNQSQQQEENNENIPTTSITTTIKRTIISAEKMQQLRLMKTFLSDAIRFIEQIHKSIFMVGQLLSSKSKLEVVEAMDFFMTAYLYNISLAKDGIKKMLHLIWTKDTSDEGKGIKLKLLDCYRTLYLDADEKLSRKQNTNLIAKNLTELTFNATLAELTSLEQVLCTLMIEGDITDDVIEKLWDVYGFSKGHIPKKQRRGSIIILGMLAKANTDVVSEKIDLMLNIGLGPIGKHDLVVAKYTCIALQRLAGTKSDKCKRLPMTHPIFSRLKNMIESPSDSMEWFSMVEQAINAIYLLGNQPDLLCGEIIKTKANETFKEDNTTPTENNPTTDDEHEHENENSMDVDEEVSNDTQLKMESPEPLTTARPSLTCRPYILSQLFFLVGHIALKQTVHLEVIEAAWKRKKSKLDEEKAKNKDKGNVDDELEQVGGTAEDDIGDEILRIREREILFSPKSLLARFGPLITEVCARNKVYMDRTLQVMATLALGKFMCVSSEFCERHLQLLLTILEKSKDPTIRSNIVIALGDMAVCFNTLIDDNISFLYNRLADEDKLVKKNAVMVLTHLILNGMVKVKGQISEMAKCLEDSDQRISDLAKLFFTELANKDNAIYNNLPDILSNLTAKSENRVEEESFHRIMKFIFSFEFVEKGKHAENVIDKLCQRFQNADEERGWRDIAFCLSLLPFKTERAFRKLLDALPYYQDKLHEESVLKSFKEIISKGRTAQKLQKLDLKAVIDELESKIDSICGVSEEDKQKQSKPKKKGT
ncbi:non-SMC mitotic condensation complex subunit 1-domain-containing protein [Cunninghamella echinulata]|nr:non-SMC mitotic condensation complex subunit 1-domain-containing protein [Cunninghamella echinulata]